MILNYKIDSSYGGEVLISEWSGWRFDSRYEIFSLLDRKKKII
jgi:hypothetical protein